MTAVSGLTKTHCPYCSLQCGITLDRRHRTGDIGPAGRFSDQPGRPVRKGLDRGGIAGSSGAPDTPLVRDSRGEPLRPADWDEALDRIAAGSTGRGTHTARTASAVSAAAG